MKRVMLLVALTISLFELTVERDRVCSTAVVSMLVLSICTVLIARGRDQRSLGTRNNAFLSPQARVRPLFFPHPPRKFLARLAKSFGGFL